MPNQHIRRNARRHARDSAEVYQAGLWFDSLETDAATFDAAALDKVTEGFDTGRAPSSLKAVFDAIDTAPNLKSEQLPKIKGDVLKALMDGVDAYAKQHGEMPSADLINYALSQASRACMDSANVTTGQSKATSFVANDVRTAIYAPFRDAIPFAYCMPTDPARGNKQQLAIPISVAGSNLGQYKQADAMNGGNAGKTYLFAARAIKVVEGTAKITTTMLSDDECDPAADAVPLRRGLTSIQVAGLSVARENPSVTGDASLGGQLVLAGQSYVVSGMVRFASSEVVVTFEPPLPDNTPVHARVVIDYENNPQLQPVFKAQVLDYVVYAEQHYGYYTTTEEQKEQIARELGIDVDSAAQLGMASQFNLERYYFVLRHALRLAFNNNSTFDFDWTEQKAQKSRADVWTTFQAHLGAVSQKMVLQTQDHGITHLYVDAQTIAPEISALPSTMFAPSGASETTNITFMGILFGKYRVYAVNNLFKNIPNGSGKILCIGRSEQAALNPFIVGDITPLRFEAVGRTTEHRNKGTVKGNGFTEVNPHQPAAFGCAMIDVVNLI